MFASVALLIFAAIVAFAAATDLLTMRIPNRVSLSLAVAFLVAAPLAGLGPTEILSHIGAGAVVLAASIGLFAVGGFGGGDAKLLPAAALWIGFEQLLPFLAYTTVFGGILSLAVLAYRRYPVLGIRAPDWAMNLHKPGTGIPYGIAIASSGLLVLPLTPWVVAAVG